ncbi:MAG: bifunctional phosphopantothenoylcysteine decarboxylase/phosphopantothenate--cysteine ligase CoaBC [Bacteroidales bacterium]|nr:bifunctional phosphopantothenoylcysteine decarboxylase/phosphopantothenate--cysteine ligase CoaBC [Bacteroidales bacterium]
MLNGKKILIGITGGIAAYKTATLIRLLVKAGAEVKVVMSATAKQFISPLTVATLSKNPVLADFFNPENGEWNSHVKLGIWADLYVIAPATANSMAKIACGIADNLLLTTCLSARCKIMLAPAMDLDMFQNPMTQRNIQILKNQGFIFVDAKEGELASGLSGKGRMAEPEEIFESIEKYFTETQDFVGKKILITAGPTREKIDPVRFISNYSTGKMGYAIAETLANRGAEIILISGPVEIKPINNKIQLVSVESAQEMYNACKTHFPQCDVAIMSAAVADYTPETTAPEKIKKDSDNQMILKLVPTPDIASEMGKLKTEKQVLVGFALETENELNNATNKLSKKNLDFIILNSLKDKGAGFGYDTNKITIVYRDSTIEKFELKSKAEVAQDIADRIYPLLK